MGSVGEVTVELNLDSTKFTKGIKDALNQLNSLDKKASSISGSLSKLSGSTGGGIASKLSGLGGGIASKIGGMAGGAMQLGGAAVLGGVAAIGAAAATAGTFATKALSDFKDFEKEVVNTAAVTGKMGAEFEAAKKNISDVAKQLGDDTVFSSQQAAAAMYNVASAGIDVSNMTSGQLKPALDLAAGTQEDLTKTTDTLLAVSAQFGIDFKDNARVADVFAKSISGSQATMDKLAYSFNYVGPVAQAAGMSLEQTTAALDVLYDNGLKGQQAGTGLRGVIASLASPSTKAAGVLKSLGLTVEDVNPETHDLSVIMGLLQERGMTTAQAFQVFNRAAAPAAEIFMKNSAAIKQYEEDLKSAGGSASNMAEQQMDTLFGSLEKLEGSLENLFIGVGEKIAPVIRMIADALDAAMPGITTFVEGAVGGFVEVVEKLRGSAGAIGTIFETVKKIIVDVFAELNGTGMSMDFVHGINVAMTMLSNAFYDAAPAISYGIKLIINFVRNLVIGLKPTYENLKTIATSIGTALGAMFSGVGADGGKGIANTITGVINIITGLLAQLSTAISKEVVEIAPKIREVFGQIVAGIQEFITNFDAVKSAVEAKFAALEMVFGQLAKKLQPAWDAIVNIFEVGMQTLGSSLGNGTAWDKLKQIWDELPKIIDDAIKKLNPVWDFLNEAFTFASNVIEGFLRNISPSFDNIKSIFEDAVTIFETIGGQLGDIMSEIFKALGGGENGSGGKGLGSGIADIVNAITGALKWLFDVLANNPKLVEFAVTLGTIALAAMKLSPVVTFVAGAVGWLAGIIAGAIPIIVGIGGAIMGVVAFFVEFGLTWETIGVVIGYAIGTLFPALGAALLGAGGIISTIAGAVIPVLGAALAALLSPIGLVVAGLVIFALAWYKNWFGIRDWTSKAIDYIGEKWKGLREWLGEIADALGRAWEGIQKGGSDAVGALDSSWDKLGDIFSDLWESVKEKASEAFDGIKSSIGAAVSSIVAVVASTIFKIVNTWYTLQSAVSDVWGFIGFIASKALDGIVDKAEQIVTGIQNKWSALQAVASGVWESIEQTVSAAIDSIVNKAEQLVVGIQNKWNMLQAVAAYVWDYVEQTVSNAIDSITADAEQVSSRIQSSWSSIQSVATSVWNYVQQAATNAINGMIQAAQSAVDSITAKWNTIQGIVTDVWNQVSATVNGVSFQGILTKIQEIIDKFWETVNQIPGVKSGLEVLNSISYNSLKTSIQGYMDKFQESANKIPGVKSAIEKLNSISFSSLKTSIQSVIDKFGDVISAAQNMYSKVSTIVNNALSSIAKVGSSGGSSNLAKASAMTASEKATRAANNTVYNNTRITNQYNTSTLKKSSVKSATGG